MRCMCVVILDEQARARTHVCAHARANDIVVVAQCSGTVVAVLVILLLLVLVLVVHSSENYHQSAWQQSSNLLFNPSRRARADAADPACPANRAPGPNPTTLARACFATMMHSYLLGVSS